MAHPNQGFLLRAQRVFLILGCLYLFAILLLTVPFIQTHILYLHAVKYPWFTQYDVPETYGLAPGKTLNLKITTSDNVTIGAWFVLADSYYQSLHTIPERSSFGPHIDASLQSRPTIIFFDGNAATRAAPYRIELYRAFSSRIGANVLAIDYRGFGDSEGLPSEDGLAKDARAAWDWAIDGGAKPQDVFLVGHSLGTAVAARLAAELARENLDPRGVVLMSPFSSIRTLLNTYSVLGLFPLMRPLAMIPGAPSFVARFLVHRFDTLSIIEDVKAPLLIAHAENDWEIPYVHSEELFHALTATLLPIIPILSSYPTAWTDEEWNAHKSQQSERTAALDGLVTHIKIKNFGTLDEFRRPGTGNKVTLLKTLVGEHDRIVSLEGVQDIISRF